jgi:hypothetical protein
VARATSAAATTGSASPVEDAAAVDVAVVQGASVVAVVDEVAAVVLLDVAEAFVVLVDVVLVDVDELEHVLDELVGEVDELDDVDELVLDEDDEVDDDGVVEVDVVALAGEVVDVPADGVVVDDGHATVLDAIAGAGAGDALDGSPTTNTRFVSAARASKPRNRRGCSTVRAMGCLLSVAQDDRAW